MPTKILTKVCSVDILRALGVGGSKARELDGVGDPSLLGVKAGKTDAAGFAARMSELKQLRTEQKIATATQPAGQVATEEDGESALGSNPTVAGEGPLLIIPTEEKADPVAGGPDTADSQSSPDDADTAVQTPLAVLSAAADGTAVPAPRPADNKDAPGIEKRILETPEQVAPEALEEAVASQPDEIQPAKETSSPPVDVSSKTESLATAATAGPDANADESSVARAASVREDGPRTAAPPVAGTPTPEAGAKDASPSSTIPRVSEFPAAGPAQGAVETPERAPELAPATDKKLLDGIPEKTKETVAQAGPVKAASESQPVFVIPLASSEHDSASTVSSPAKPHAQIVQAHLDAPDARQVFAAIRTEKSGSVDLRLDPPDLGRVRIHFSFERTDAVTATVTADRGDTLDLMRRHAGDLARDLQRAGFEGVRLEFASNDNHDARPQEAASDRFSPDWFEDEPVDARRVVYLSMRTDNRLDRLV